MSATTRSRGFTLIEMMIAVVVLTVIVGGSYAILGTGVDTYGSGVARDDLERHGNRVLARIIEEIGSTGTGIIYPTPYKPYSTEVVNYQHNLGFAGDAIQWGPPMRLELVYHPDDPDDGRDNNGNGLVDECRVLLTENPGQPNERTVVLTEWVREYLEGEEPNGQDDNGNGFVDERGLCFDLLGDVWTIRLTLERLDTKNRLVTHTLETSVKPRNQ